jgi:hypothetical protein
MIVVVGIAAVVFVAALVVAGVSDDVTAVTAITVALLLLLILFI